MEAQKKFDSTNAEHLKFQYDMIGITILGGIRLEGLDRLRVTAEVIAKFATTESFSSSFSLRTLLICFSYGFHFTTK